jgi:hypothetical protein
LKYRSQDDSRNVTAKHTLDFFVLHEESAGWVECKMEAELVRLVKKMPFRYQQRSDGSWFCPPGEAYEEAWEEANHRYVIITGTDQETKTPARTVRRWRAQWAEALASYGNGLIGLLPRVKSRGNRRGRLDERTEELIEVFITEHNAKAFNVREVENKQVPVRYDPFDLGTAYVYVRGRWVQARSEHYLRLRGHSERELQIASAELRKQYQNHTRDAAITAKRLADFLADLSSHDTVLRQHWQDAEARDVFVQMKELPGSSSDPEEEYVAVLALVQTEAEVELAESGASKPRRSRHRQPAVIIEDDVDLKDLDEYGRF